LSQRGQRLKLTTIAAIAKATIQAIANIVVADSERVINQTIRTAGI